MGLDATLQMVKGILDRQVHMIHGQKFDYTNYSDLTATPIASSMFSGIYLCTTPTKYHRIFQDGRFIRRSEDTYMVSRESLKLNGVYYVPTMRDTFIRTDGDGQIFRVVALEDIDELPGSFKLIVNRESEVYIGG